MGFVTNIRIRRLLYVALLAMLLGAQTAQAGHFHADVLFAEDCLQCSVDGGHAVRSIIPAGPIVTKPAFEAPFAVSAAVFTSHYRRAARGPPA